MQESRTGERATHGRAAALVVEGKLKKHLQNLYAAETGQGTFLQVNEFVISQRDAADASVEDLEKLRRVLASKNINFVVEALKILIHLTHHGADCPLTLFTARFRGFVLA